VIRTDRPSQYLAPELDALQVHLCYVPLARTDEDAHACWHELTADERARADRFATPQLRRRYVAARATLRRLLSKYLALDVRDIPLAYGSCGKPFLASAQPLYFNVSHANDMAIYALASGREVGVDIEAATRDVDVDGVARMMFSPRECDALAVMSREARHSAFFRIWTRKEAYVKLLGHGLGYPTRFFTVSHHKHDDALIEDDRDALARQRCRVIGLPAPPGFAAALAAKGRDWSLVEVDPCW
jgi:4'-phosphopantetheinyl transferase